MSKGTKLQLRMLIAAFAAGAPRPPLPAPKADRLTGTLSLRFA